MSVESALWIAGVAGEAIVFAVLLYRRAWRTFPFFLAFCAWLFLSDSGAFVVVKYLPKSYGTFYLTQAVIESALEFSVLVEIAWSVLRPIRASLPRRTLPMIILLVFVLAIAVWPISGVHAFSSWPHYQTVVHVQQTAAILRVLLFLLLAGCSQLLAIGWRDRELQIATGLGFYSLVSLFAAMMHMHETSMVQYRQLNQLPVASAVCTFAYWTFAFAQKEAARREFTPQMQNFLLTVAGVARAEREALTASSAQGQRRI
ncbi:MAG TPA: hypothetical protein VL967_13825 [Terracidiphilus sp.]|nr:hypothetical protein [Terracidiphilus sp.]